MDQAFLERILHVARNITQAERGLVVNADAQILKTENIDSNVLESDAFSSFALGNLREAIATGEAIIANNVITDLSEAPTTNTNFADLRIGVALPVSGHGGVYLDRHIRDGVIPKQTIDRLMGMVTHILENQLEDQDEESLLAIYEQVR